MKKCPACAESIQDDALKCRFCGEILISEEWRSFCERFAALSPEDQEVERAKLTDVQSEIFDSAWLVLGPQLRAKSMADAEPGPTTHPHLAPTPAVPPQPQPKKGSSPIVVGCLVLVILGAFISLLGNLDLGGGNRSSSPPTKATQRSPEEKARQLEADYKRAKAALERGDYGNAEALLTRVQQEQAGYLDVEELLASPEVKKVSDEKARRRRVQSLRSVYARRNANIRSGAGTNYRIVRQASTGESLKYETKEGDWYKLGTLSGEAEWVHESVVITESEKRRRDSAQLQLVDWRLYKEHSYAFAEGRVKNVSSESIEHVEAVVQWFTASGDFVKSDSCLIDYDPILVGQTSPFKCGTSSNPAMTNGSISFKRLLGGTLTYYQD